ncbi:MAG: hypothetical protein F6K65_23715, partial [Moorea sp. SIO3C2]|nr:hypothetical protein [Moorena sp. SIO3C2]
NTYQGVVISEASNPTIRSCRIYDGKENGVWITDNGLGTLEDCDIYGNTSLGVEINNNSNPTFRRCRIENHPFPGIQIEEGCNPLFRRCILRSNRPFYLGIAGILSLSIALPVAIAGGWLITPTIAVALAVIGFVFYKLRKNRFNKQYIIGIIYLTLALGFNLGCTFLLSFNIYNFVASFGTGLLWQRRLFKPLFKQSKLISKYQINRLP